MLQSKCNIRQLGNVVYALIMEVVTRWDSFYDMIDRIHLDFEQVNDALKECKRENLMMTPLTKEIIEELMEVLKPFKIISNKSFRVIQHHCCRWLFLPSDLLNCNSRGQHQIGLVVTSVIPSSCDPSVARPICPSSMLMKQLHTIDEICHQEMYVGSGWALPSLCK